MNLHRHRPNRNGFAIVEAMAAFVILAAGLMATAQVLVVCARQRLSSDQLLSAQFEAGNVAERIAAIRYDQLTPSNLAQLKLSVESQASLPGGQLRVTVADDATAEQPNSDKGEKQAANETAAAQNDLAKYGDSTADAAQTAKHPVDAQAKCIHVEVRWPWEASAAPEGTQSHANPAPPPEHADQPDHVVSLTVWKYAPAEPKP
ncbi:MAG TPA: hypothetical protein VMJ32_08920 [Pirellulales bacterium]|nr:hypothetical protein [Pirellulales bacterium]